MSLTIHSCDDCNSDWEPANPGGQTIGGDDDKVTVEVGKWKIHGGDWESTDITKQIIE